MKNIRIFSENFHFLVVKFSVYLNRRVFVMDCLFSVRSIALDARKYCVYFFTKTYVAVHQ